MVDTGTEALDDDPPRLSWYLTDDGPPDRRKTNTGYSLTAAVMSTAG